MDKNILDIIKLLTTVLVAVIGWLIGYYFTSKRDISNKRRDITLQHLINAYRILTNDISHRPHSKERQHKLESIISDIQLFGSKEQAEIVAQLARDMAAKKDYEYDTIINSLRADLREQLDLEHINGNVTWLRYTDD